MAVHRAAAIGGIDNLGHYVKNWRQIYRNTQYVDAMNRLNKFVGENPDDAAGRFLRGYHFMYLDQTDYAKRELAKVVELEPKDRLAADLISQLTGTEEKNGTEEKLPTMSPPIIEDGTTSRDNSSAPDSHDHSDHDH